MPTESQSSKNSLPVWSVVKFAGRIWVIVTSVIGSLLVLGILALISAFSSMEAPLDTPQYSPKRIIESGSEDSIAVVNLSGVISEEESGPNAFSGEGSISSRKVVSMLNEFEKDDSIKAIVLHVNSPGGAVVASDDLYRKIVEVKKTKPVVISMGDVAASGGYYLSAGSSYIVANPATITGSIGVIAQFPKLAGLYDKIGVEMRTFKSGQFKDIGSESRDVTPEEQQIIQSMIDESYNQFVAAIVNGRKLDETQVRQIADGRIYTGKQAFDNKLVDELGNVDVAITKAKQLAQADDASVYEYSDESFFETILSSRLSGIFPIAGLTPVKQSGLYYLLEF